MGVRGDYLYTQITNPTKKDKSFLEKGVVTTKPDRRLHGKGVGIATTIVRYYNGRRAIRIEDGIFTVEFMLDIKYAEEKTHE